jgi:hypothetical protein
MSHKEQIDFFLMLKQKFPQMFSEVDVLEIGSLDINGSIRGLFDAKTYIGVDLDNGPSVDVVGEGQNLTYDDGSFDVTVSAECFEHNPYWLETFLNMCRMSSSFVIFTCASEGRPEHGTSATTPQNSPFTVKWDYYKNLNKEDFESHIDFSEIFFSYEFSYNSVSKDLYFWGIKK